MAAPSSPLPNAQATLSVPRVRFLFSFVFLVTATIYTLSRIISGTNLPALYRTAAFCSIFTELLTLKMFVPTFSMSPAVIEAITSSTVLPHLFISIFLWINSSTFLVQLISMMIVYSYLVFEYVPMDDMLRQNQYWRTYGSPFAALMAPMKANFLNYAAHLEILNLVLVLVSLIRMKGNLLHLIVFVQYITSQYISSPIMRHAVLFWDTIVTRLLNDPRCPPVVKVADVKVREALRKLVGFTNQFVRPSPRSTAANPHKPHH